MLQEYACTGVGWGVWPKRIFEYRGGWGVYKWSFGGVRTLWMAPNPIYKNTIQYNKTIQSNTKQNNTKTIQSI